MTTAMGAVGVSGATHLVAGVQVPEVALSSTAGGTIDLATLPGTSIVFIYPWTGRPGVPNPPGWDDIPGAHGSTPQTEGFRDQWKAFQAAGFEVFGLSTQSRDWQKECAQRLRLPFELLSDNAFAFADDLDLPRFVTAGTAYLSRLTLIVRDGRIVETIYPVTDPAGHAAELLARLGRLAIPASDRR